MDATASGPRLVAAVRISDSDARVMRRATDELERLQVQHEERVFPPSGEGLLGYLEEAEGRGVAVAIVGTFHAYSDEPIPSAQEAPLPIFRFATGPVPSTLGELALHVGFMGFGIDGAVNAALQAARILARSDPDLADRLRVSLGLLPES